MALHRKAQKQVFTSNQPRVRRALAEEVGPGSGVDLGTLSLCETEGSGWTVKREAVIEAALKLLS